MKTTFSQYLYQESLYTGLNSFNTNWLTFKFANLIRKPFNEWDAYRYGIISRTGDIIRNPRTNEEHKAFGLFESLVRKVKKALIKYSHGDLVQTLIALYLLKKESVNTKDEIIRREIVEDLDNDEISLLEDIIKNLKNNMK
jgi:hypothetical protein